MRLLFSLKRFHDIMALALTIHNFKALGIIWVSLGTSADFPRVSRKSRNMGFLLVQLPVIATEEFTFPGITAARSK